MGKIVKLTVVGIIIILIVTGCTFVKSPEELVRRPKETLEEDEIYNIISKFLTKNKTLTLSTNQKDEEAIRRVDIDDDGNDELFVLYKKTDSRHQSNQSYGILILKKKGNDWYEINRIIGSSYPFDLVENWDITGDKNLEIFIGSNTENQIDKRLSIYSYHDGYFRSIYNTNYRDLGIGDLNQDGLNDVILLNKNLKNDTTYLEVLNYLNNEMSTLTEHVFYNKSYFSNMIVGKASETNTGVFIDHDIRAYKGYTDLLIMRNNRMIEILTNTTAGYQQKLNGNITESRDINNDGIIEFGFIEKLTIIGETIDYDIPFIKKWYQWNGSDKTFLVQREYYSYDEGYKIVIPKEWEEAFTIMKKRDEDKVDFFSLNNNGKLDQNIFSIKSFKKNVWDKEKLVLDDNKYIVLKENIEDVVVGIIYFSDKMSKYYMDEERLKGVFYSLKE